MENVARHKKIEIIILEEHEEFREFRERRERDLGRSFYCACVYSCDGETFLYEQPLKNKNTSVYLMRISCVLKYL